MITTNHKYQLRLLLVAGLFISNSINAQSGSTDSRSLKRITDFVSKNSKYWQILTESQVSSSIKRKDNVLDNFATNTNLSSFYKKKIYISMGNASQLLNAYNENTTNRKQSASSVNRLQSIKNYSIHAFKINNFSNVRLRNRIEIMQQYNRIMNQHRLSNEILRQAKFSNELARNYLEIMQIDQRSFRLQSDILKNYSLKYWNLTKDISFNTAELMRYNRDYISYILAADRWRTETEKFVSQAHKIMLLNAIELLPSGVDYVFGKITPNFGALNLSYNVSRFVNDFEIIYNLNSTVFSLSKPFNITEVNMFFNLMHFHVWPLHFTSSLWGRLNMMPRIPIMPRLHEWGTMRW